MVKNKIRQATESQERPCKKYDSVKRDTECIMVYSGIKILEIIASIAIGEKVDKAVDELTSCNILANTIGIATTIMSLVAMNEVEKLIVHEINKHVKNTGTD